MREEKEPIEKEISSHSSKLTNQRLAYILLDIDRWNQECYRNPCIPNIEAYFSSVYTFYNNTFPVFLPKENEQLLKIFRKYFQLYFGVKTAKKVSPTVVFYMIFLIDRLNRLMKGFLQKRKYFFKLMPGKVVGVEKSLEVIEQGGAFFGGVKPAERKFDIPEREAVTSRAGAVQGVSTDTDKPKPEKH